MCPVADAGRVVGSALQSVGTPRLVKLREAGVP
jgi:hypothetical protein